MLKNDTLKNGTSRIGLYGSAPPEIKGDKPCPSTGVRPPHKVGNQELPGILKVIKMSSKCI